MCEVKQTFRRLGMEVEFPKTARRIKHEGIWRDITHSYTLVAQDGVVYNDNDLIEVWLPDFQVATEGGDVSTDSSGSCSSGNSSDGSSEDTGDDKAIKCSNGRGKYLAKFVIEAIFIQRQRKCIEGFFWEETEDGLKITNPKPAVILARQTVAHIKHSKAHELVGLMKKQREAWDKVKREEEGEKARLEALEKARKKRSKVIDFDKPSVWGNGPRETRKKKPSSSANRSKPDNTTPTGDVQQDQSPVTWYQNITSIFSTLSGLDACCGVRLGSYAARD